jgi:parvulin-like peptidyl-prolyl isomerase
MQWRATWTAALALALACLPAAAQTSVPAKPAPAQPVAVVNGVEITLAQLEAALALKEPDADSTAKESGRQSRLEALHLLVDKLLMHQFLEANAPALAPGEIEKRLEELKANLLAPGQDKSIEEFCLETGQTMADLPQSVADQLRWYRYALSLLNDEAVRAYYQENKDLFEGNTVKASHIAIRVSTGSKDAEMRARNELNVLRMRLLDQSHPLDFAEAARTHSQDQKAAPNGDLGYFSRKCHLDDGLCKAAFGLQVGQISEVVKTDYGLHLIKVTDRKAGPGFDFAKGKDKVREEMLEDLREKILAQQRKIAKQAGKLVIHLP